MAEARKDSLPTIYLSATDTDLPHGFTNDFGKYTGFREMAGGGSGVLLACLDNNLGRRVCIKRLPPESSENRQERRRLLREPRVTAQMQHPNTVPVYELGRDRDGHLYFAMKKVEGRNLFRILSGIAQKEDEIVREFSLDRLLGILIQASNALSYAHAHGVIHRDVKPENIMVGLFGEVLLMDWGVAKVWGVPDDLAESDGPAARGGDDDLADRLTSPGQRPGTPLYMSPEQVRGVRHIDERTDIFSMGVVLYETLALREPFRGKNVNETFQNILHLTPMAPSEVSRDWRVPRRLDEICLKAIEKNPSNRYQHIQNMIDDIRNFRDQAIQAE